MNQSHRHHYVPQFILKEFADESGMLHVYDKQKKAVIKQKRSTKSIFFEHDRNTIEIGGQPSDNIEKLYAGLDTELSEGYTDLLRRKAFTEDNFFPVMMLFNLLKWRVPVNDAEFEKQNSALGYDELPIRILADGKDLMENPEAFRHLINSELFQTGKRFIFPVLPFYDDAQIRELLAKVYVHTNPSITSLIGDVPFIEHTPASSVKIGDFIFPLSNTDTLIFSHAGKGRVQSNLFYYQKDLAILHSAQRYVACRNEEHLKKAGELYEAVYMFALT